MTPVTQDNLDLIFFLWTFLYYAFLYTEQKDASRQNHLYILSLAHIQQLLRLWDSSSGPVFLKKVRIRVHLFLDKEDKTFKTRQKGVGLANLRSTGSKDMATLVSSLNESL